MKVTLVERDRRVCRLRPGEVKRLPAAGPLLGFYVACPACGFLNVVLAEGQHVEEAAGGLTLAPGFRCDGGRCGRHVHIKHGELVIADSDRRET